MSGPPQVKARKVVHSVLLVPPNYDQTLPVQILHRVSLRSVVVLKLQDLPQFPMGFSRSTFDWKCILNYRVGGVNFQYQQYLRCFFL